MSYSNQRGNSRSVEEGMMLWGVILFFIVAGCCFAWWRFHGEIAAAVMALQRWQMHQIAYLTGSYAGLDAQVARTDPSSVKIGALWRLLHNVGAFFRYPAAGVIAAIALVCLFRAAPSRFTRDIDLPRLMKIQSEVFPSAAAFVGRGLKLTKVQDGAPRSSDPALHAAEWVQRFALGSGGCLDMEMAAHALSLQLGPVWRGPAEAAPQVRCMIAVFALHAARRREEALQLLGVLARSLPVNPGDGPGGPPAPLAFGSAAVAEADRILLDRALVAPCKEVAGLHAFTASALMSVLTLARKQAGVLAPAQFAFLKMVDRQLWYALHSLGFPGGQNRAEQPNPRIEAAGARDHWAAERDVGHPLPLPSLDRSLAVVRKKAGEAGLVATSTPEHRA